MKGNILQTSALEAILARASRLRPDARPLWGTMTVAKMLRHCNEAHSAILVAPPKPELKTGIKQAVVKFIILNMLKQLPKGRKGPPQFDQSGMPEPDFATQLAAFSEVMKRCGAHKALIQAVHPYAGRMTNKQWGTFLWMHADHHLRQFGV